MGKHVARSAATREAMANESASPTSCATPQRYPGALMPWPLIQSSDPVLPLHLRCTHRHQNKITAWTACQLSLLCEGVVKDNGISCSGSVMKFELRHGSIINKTYAKDAVTTYACAHHVKSLQLRRAKQQALCSAISARARSAAGRRLLDVAAVAAKVWASTKGHNRIQMVRGSGGGALRIA